MGEGPGKSSEAAAQPSGVLAPVFISYASQDTDDANQICESLEAQGITCWIAPRDVKPGAEYADAIVRAINDAKAIVLVMSAGAVASAHVGREVERAASKRKAIIAFRVDAAPLSAALEYFLSQSQWIDVPALGTKAALAKLKEAVGQGSATPSQTVPTRPTRGIWKRIVIPVAIIIALGVLIGAGVYFWVSKHGAHAPSVAVITDKSIAVLPFVDMSEKKDQEYFADGLSEELIDMLTKVPELQVTARTSSFYFKGKQSTIAEIARALNVANVLEGSVRKSGNKLRITAQLVRVDNGFHLWSETYDKNLDDIFKVQDEIAAAVVSALRLSLLSRTLPKASGTTNSEAYTLYLQAGGLVGRGTLADLEKAGDYTRQALQLDPGFAAGWARLTQTITTRYEAGTVPFAEASEGARRAAERAIALGPDLGAAHLAKARVHVFFDWDWRAADAEIRRARQLDPNDVDTLRWAGGLALTVGHFAESVTLLNQAVGRDPLMAANYMQLGLAQRAIGNTAKAQSAWQKAVDLAPPDGLGARQGLWEQLLFTGNSAELLANCPQSPADERTACQAIGYFVLGKKPEADAALSTLLTRYAMGNEVNIAGIYAFRDEADQAFTWLDRAYDARASDLLGILGDPFLKSLRSDPRYKALLKKMNLPSD
jgi:TolB-like protein